MDTVNKDNIFIGFNDLTSSNYVFDEDAPTKTGNGKLGLSSLSDDQMALAINGCRCQNKKRRLFHLK